MLKLKTGVYEVFGNTVEYEGGNEGYDLDSRDFIPIEIISAMGVFIKTLEEFYNE